MRPRKLRLNEIIYVFGDRHTGYVAASLYLRRNISRNIIGPVFERIESDNPEWAIVLTSEQIADHRFEVGALYLRFTVHRAVREAINNEIRRFVRAKRDDAG